MSVGPLRPKGPALNALRAVEAAARLGSFVAAAEELGVTPGAISQHVKTVEIWAGATLFERTPQGVSPRPFGRELSQEFTQAFDLLAGATQKLRNLAPNPDIHIAALPSIAQLWLPTRLSRLRAARPDLKISVTALENPPRLTREIFDLSVFFATPDDSADQIVVADDIVFPVCSPNLMGPADLASVALLHDQMWQQDWSFWAAETGIDVGDPSRGARYSLYALAVEEAKAGAGALMGHGCLIEQALSDAQLRRMSARECKTGRALVIQLPHRSRRHPEIEQVVRLLS